MASYLLFLFFLSGIFHLLTYCRFKQASSELHCDQVSGVLLPSAVRSVKRDAMGPTVGKDLNDAIVRPDCEVRKSVCRAVSLDSRCLDHDKKYKSLRRTPLRTGVQHRFLDSIYFGDTRQAGGNPNADMDQSHQTGPDTAVEHNQHIIFHI